MDHLPYPTNPAHVPLHIPVLVNADVEIDCNQARPVRRWREAKAAFASCGLRKLTRILQHWLYFGLISRCLGQRVRVRDFLSDTYLNLKSLPVLFDGGRIEFDVEELKGVELELRAFAAENLRSCCTRPGVDCTGLDGVDYNAHLVILSIRILSDSIRRAYSNRESNTEDMVMRHEENYDNPYAPAGFHCAILRHRMSWENGWCRSMVSSILQTLTASTAYYLSAIKRPRAVSGAPNHQDYTDDRCNLHYDEKNYQQVHTHQCPGEGNEHCKMVQAPLGDVMKILQEGGIPLMKLVSNTLVASTAKYGMPYVAATHGWAGGLGNPQGNKMWTCQLQEMLRLTTESQQAIRSFEPGLAPQNYFPTVWDNIVNPFGLLPKSPPTWFWIDTLNIPRVDEESESQEFSNDVWAKRTLAIDRMTQTYAAADSAIVLDPELRQLDLQWHQRGTDPDDNQADQYLLQIFSSILVSSWMTRCWTYQEGAMGKELLFKLSNQLFPMRLARSDVLARNRQRLGNSQYRDIHDMLDETSAWFSRLPATQQDDASVGRMEISDGDKGGPEVFTRIWNDLAARTTTRSIDRLSILSLLVDLRPSEVRQEHPRARLKAMFKAHQKLPLALLFQPPLSLEERREVSEQFDKEEKAELDRGKTLRTYSEDASYPLPTSLRSKPLPGQLGWMRQGTPQDTPQENFLFFDNDLLTAGLRQPALFGLPYFRVRSSSRYSLHDSSVPCNFELHIDLVEEDKYRHVNDAHDLYLLTSSSLQAQEAFHSSHTTFYGVLLRRESTGSRRTISDGTRPRDVWMFRYICHVTCDSFVLLDTDHSRSSSRRTEIQRTPLTDDCEYRIYCDFSDVIAPSHHRIRGFIPPWITAFDILSTIMPLLVAYYLVCFAFACIPGFAHTPGMFPRGWLAMIGFMFVMRWLFFTWNNTREYMKAANEVNFNEWVNGIGSADRTPIIDSRLQHTGSNINMNFRDTVALVFICSIFIIVGAAKYGNRNLRWMIAVGSSGLGELLLRWALEMCLPKSRFWGESTHGEHPALRADYLSPSRFTMWCRNLSWRGK